MGESIRRPFPDLYPLVTGWDTLEPCLKCNLVGKILGKYGVALLLTGGAALIGKLGQMLAAAGRRAVGLARRVGRGMGKAWRGAKERVRRWRRGTGTEAPKGGTYKLRRPETIQVRRTGRTKNLARRRAEHGRHSETRDLDFEVDRRTDSYAAQRGREQRIYDQHPEAELNRRRPISPSNPNRDYYLEEGDKL